MKKNYSKIIEKIFQHEGGYVDHPSDPGGATKMGVTRRTLAAWRGIRPFTKLPKSEVKNLKKSEAYEIYKERYWDVIQGDSLPGGIDAYLMDYGVNAGPPRAVMHLQSILGVAQDGKVGPITLGALEKKDVSTVLLKLHERRMKFYKSLSTWKTFGKGWTNRSEDMFEFSKTLISTSTSNTDNLIAVIIRILLRLFTRS